MSPVVLRVPITFEAGDGTTTHAPIVHATIGASPVRLILDTGADVHVLTREVAEAVGLQLTTLDTGTDHAGAAMDSWLAGDVEIAIAGPIEGSGRIVLGDVVTIPAPAAFIDKGFAGGLSPQRLHATAWAVIDQIDDELLLLDGDAATVTEALAARHPELPILALERHAPAGVPVVAAAIEPHAEAMFLVNTGGRHTELEPGVAPGVSGGPLLRIGTGVSGAPVMGAAAGPQVLRIGGARVALPATQLRTDIGDPPAMLGQDVLRGTVLAVGPDPATPVLWQVPQLAR